MDILPAPSIAPTAPVSPSSPGAVSAPNSTFKDVLSGLAQRMDQGETSVKAALHTAPKLGPAGELLMLQAGVYRYSETFEVAAKMVDKATNAVKTTLQGQ